MNTYLVAFDFWTIQNFYDDTYKIVEADSIPEAIQAMRELVEKEPMKFHEWKIKRVFVEEPDWRLDL